ncbi:MAG: GNAT family N-acetyltransferase [Blastocatellia bacterium]|nr:MAG: GNAT family N-acetyltransferase [Blastocatellia bacterium]
MGSIKRLSPSEAREVLPDLVSLLQDIVQGGSSVGFLPPLIDETAEKFWLETIEDIKRNERVLLVYREDGRIIGTAQLALATRQNGLHRVEVQKMLVHSQHRKRGIGRALLNEVDSVARQLNRTLLVLDTEEGSAAENLYANCGYTRVGVIPQFALTTEGSLISTVVFYKILDSSL